MTTVKLIFKDDIRRVQLPAAPTAERLCQLVCEAFPALRPFANCAVAVGGEFSFWVLFWLRV